MAPTAELATFFETWLAGATHAVRGWQLEPVAFELAVPGDHNRANAATALAVLELTGVARAEAERALASFTGVGRRFELVGERGGVRVIDDYGHNPTEIAAALSTARALEPRALIAVYQPHVYERTRQLHQELGEALGLADAAIVTDVIGGRDAPIPGVTGKLVLDDVPPPTRRGVGADTRGRIDARARVVAAGRRGRDARGGRAVADRPRGRRGPRRVTEIEHGVPLSKLTTIGVGGPARALARPRTVAELVEALRFARDEGLGVLPVGLGSNLLASDEGVDALVLKLEGELAAVEVDAHVLRAGAGATNAVCLHRARSAGLGGLEFACAIPGTAGGGVFMNAGAYGRDWADILVRALVATADGERWLAAEELGLTYRHSSLQPDEVVARVEYRLEPRPPAEIKATVAELVARRKDTQPTNKRTFGSVFKNPDGELGAGRMLELCGLKGHRIGGAVISPKHANFIENAGGATSSDCVALMVEARRRAGEEYGVTLEREVVFAGLPELPQIT